jgi:cell division protein FtsI (penicillin-binding protein 3)/stage V sporulation protein D (sporulation-specific penicillin-binding protein)
MVEDPYTGNILAMASSPGFDPNNYSAASIKDFMNPTVQLVYEPGSVFKPLTMTAGIDSGKITPNTTYIDTGSITIDGHTIHDWDLKAHGLTTMRGVIEQSLNLGTIFAEKTMGDAVFRDYVKRFGLGEKTGITLPGELSGDVRHVISGRAVDYATASFGQGITVTPIQILSAFSAIANGGLLMQPHIIAGEQPTVICRVASENTMSQVVNMMVSAVNKNILAKVEGYNVAAKSGTAYVPDFVHGGYTSDVIDTFMGFAPASHPKFVLMVKLDKPLHAPLSGEAVVPAWQQLASFILNYYQVPPDALTASSSHS